MAIRDCSGLPDDRVPEWVRRSRERSREIARRERKCARVCPDCNGEGDRMTAEFGVFERCGTCDGAGTLPPLDP